jgi:hypothetical protein
MSEVPFGTTYPRTYCREAPLQEFCEPHRLILLSDAPFLLDKSFELRKELLDRIEVR